MSKNLPVEPAIPYYQHRNPDGSLDLLGILNSSTWSAILRYLRFHIGYERVTQAIAASRVTHVAQPGEPDAMLRTRQRLAILTNLAEHFEEPAYSKTVFGSKISEKEAKPTKEVRLASVRHRAEQPVSDRRRKPRLQPTGNLKLSADQVMIADILWVYQHLGQEPKRELAPDPGKFGLWVWAYSSVSEFYRSMVPKLIAAEEEQRKAEAERKAKEEARQAEIERARTEEERQTAALLDQDHRKAKERIRQARAILAEMLG